MHCLNFVATAGWSEFGFANNTSSVLAGELSPTYIFQRKKVDNKSSVLLKYI